MTTTPAFMEITQTTALLLLCSMLLVTVVGAATIAYMHYKVARDQKDSDNGK